ncbi:MAG: NADH-quinone oxidoreductase subunit M [Candidatus Eremiobacteraeota bacterium]|nr:NADH-quinone oxidoreductase subunit M [Candidatus Eremiobacteraeota bacterium]
MDRGSALMLVLAVILLPILVAGLLLALPRNDRNLSQSIGTLVALVTLILLGLARNQEWSYRWLSRPFEASFHFGPTPISFWIAYLLALCTLCAIASASVPRMRDFTAQMLLLQGTMNGLFLARDLLVFALFWDLMLLPVFFVLIGWGRHQTTAWRYFIYNFAGGLTLLLATAAFGVIYGSTDVIGRPGFHLVGSWAPWIFAGFAFAFLVKTPVWPLHTWMPLTYADTPPPMIAVVAAVQSKAGLYGLIAIAAAFMPDYVHAYSGVFVVLGAISLLYGALVALTQVDAKRVVAYSSLSHLGLIVIAIASQNQLALQGALVYIVAHGLFSAALFIILGYVEEREGTRSLLRLGGMGNANPRLAGALCIAALAALGLPGLAGFAGEIVILIGVYQAGLVWAAIVALIAIVFASAYMLRLYQDIMNGPQLDDLPVRRDLSWNEGIAIAPLVVALVLLGVQPGPVLSSAAESVTLSLSKGAVTARMSAP